LAETVGRHLERCCYVVSVDDLESPPADILNALGVKKAHIAAAESFFESALEAAARKAALSLSFLCGRSAVMAPQRPECPVLILAFDGDEEVRKALAIRSVLGGALAVIPARQESLVAEVIEHHITLMSGRAFFTEE
jgi:hypothetical protein